MPSSNQHLLFLRSPSTARKGYARVLEKLHHESACDALRTIGINPSDWVEVRRWDSFWTIVAGIEKQLTPRV